MIYYLLENGKLWPLIKDKIESPLKRCQGVCNIDRPEWHESAGIQEQFEDDEFWGEQAATMAIFHFEDNSRTDDNIRIFLRDRGHSKGDLPEETPVDRPNIRNYWEGTTTIINTMLATAVGTTGATTTIDANVFNNDTTYTIEF